MIGQGISVAGNGVKAPLACVSIADMFKFVEVILLYFLVKPQLSIVDTESFVGEPG